MKPQIFISVSAAAGNIGDVFIRRQAISLCGQASAELSIYTGGMPADYIASLNIPTTARVTDSSLRFLSQLLAALLLSTRSTFVISPGPAFLGRTALSRVKHALLCVIFGVAKMRGWTTLVLGRSIVGGSRVDQKIERLICRLSSLYIARDASTVHRIGGPAELLPDLAFNQSPRVAGGGRRNRLVVSVRYDRAIPEWFYDEVSSLSQSKDLEITVVTQVREDNDLNACIAERLVAKHVSWPPGVTAAQQERRLFATYDEAAICVSDRLHVIALSMLSGAAPLVYKSREDSKIIDALGPFFTLPELTEAGGGSGYLCSREQGERRAAAVEEAHDRVRTLSARIAELVGRS